MRYNVFVTNCRTGTRVRMNRSPLTLAEAATLKGKITTYSWREIAIEPVKEDS